MGLNVTYKLLQPHLVEGTSEPGEEIGIRINQTLTQDATGTLVMLTVEAMGLDRVATELSAQYVDHNLVQADNLNADDHLFLQSACRRFGIWYSGPGNGVSHPVHMQRFGKPGKTLLGSDSHTCASGALGMLAIGAGGIDVAMAMAGEPFHFTMPKVWGVRLVGELPEWVSAKDVILEMLRRHDVDGGLGRIIEYHGPGLAGLSAMDRHVIANMGAELGATTSVFPSDATVRRFLAREGREADWREIVADADCRYDIEEEIDLSQLEPLIALPSSPGKVVPVREIAGREVYQSYIGSSANPGYRDFAVVAAMVRAKPASPEVSLDVNPTSRALLEMLSRDGHLLDLVHAGARLHQAGCNGCIGMGQAPASGRNSLRTVPRNFPGRSGTPEDSVYLCSPETAAAAAMMGRITDPRDLGIPFPKVAEPEDVIVVDRFTAPLPVEEARGRKLVKGPNIVSLPELDPLPESFEVPVLLKMDDDVSTDEIMPAGARVLPYRSNIPKISEFAFSRIDETYVERANETGGSGHAVVAGENYGQGSSREHAALAPRYLGLRLAIAKSFARIHAQNLVSYGVLPLTFCDPADHGRLDAGATVRLDGIAEALRSGRELAVRVDGQGPLRLRHLLTSRQIEILTAGGLANWFRARA